MSRGLGQLQRRILTAVAERQMSARMIAVTLFGEDATPTDRSNVRRAVRKLVMDGHLSQIGTDDKGGLMWTSPENAKRTRAAFKARYGF